MSGVITFDPGSAPCNFAETQPLRNEYADLGVHFRAPSPGTGGAILNECGMFGIDARSGAEFLAYNTGTYATLPQFIRFDDLQESVELYVGAGGGGSKFTLKAKNGGEVVARSAVKPEAGQWTPLSVSSDDGISRVILRGDAPIGYFVVDDLTFTSP